MTNITNNLLSVHKRIARAAESCGRDPGEIRLVAVSKKHPAAAVIEAWDAGQKDFGENFLQEALPKQAELSHLPLTWHFIGRIQSNKTRPIAEQFQWVHTVDRIKIAQRLNEQRPESLPPLNVCIQVNVGDPDNKAGAPRDQVAELAKRISSLPRLRLRGLMCLPPESEDKAVQRGYFHILYGLRQEIDRLGIKMDTLSMGMSGDLEAAVAEGATMVRIGTAVFGQRMAA
ncbi:MAG: YggS family pyridoxal phosphate-dependent enzyme [Chromatiales bacterium]|nr:YggS family pyridoxal phosphate-dependent enzyme [Chromatiales bacterium]